MGLEVWDPCIDRNLGHVGGGTKYSYLCFQNKCISAIYFLEVGQAIDYKTE